MMEVHNRRYLEQTEESAFDRTIAIDVVSIGTMEFSLSRQRSMKLYDAGRTTAEELLETVTGDQKNTVIEKPSTIPEVCRASYLKSRSIYEANSSSIS